MTETPDRAKQNKPLKDRLSDDARKLRKDAECLPPGPERETLLKKARHAETAANIDQWLTSPGLRPPE